MKKETVKEMFSPVIKNFERHKIQTQKTECWSIDLINEPSLAKYNKNYNFCSQ